MKNQIISNFEQRVFKDKKTDLPEFRPGDTLRVEYKIQESTSDKFRIQAFEGVCIRKKKGTANGTFTVRKMAANNVGVERVFPMYSPNIQSLHVKARGIVRRSRLYYLRDLTGKAARIRSRFTGSAKPKK